VIPLSGRHSLLALVAVWVCAAAVAFHAVAKPRADDCASPGALLAPDLFANTVPGSATATRQGKRAFAENRGEVLTDDRWRAAPRWRLLRTYDLKGSYFAPSGLFSMVSPEDRDWVVTRSAGGRELPIHVRVDDTAGYANVAAYLYVFAGEPVARPFTASLREALPQLLAGALPLTVLLAEGDAELDRAEVSQELLVDWVRSAWVEYEAACGS
jgi:hypothetical protein